jgi:hypothetical protein
VIHLLTKGFSNVYFQQVSNFCGIVWIGKLNKNCNHEIFIHVVLTGAVLTAAKLGCAVLAARTGAVFAGAVLTIGNE